MKRTFLSVYHGITMIKLKKQLFCLQNTVATTPVALHWLCDSPRTGCSWRTKLYTLGANKK